MIFRFDDVCKNANMQEHHDFTDHMLKTIDGCEVIWAISPLVCKSEAKTGRVFPQRWNAMSDLRQHYKLDDLQIPGIHPKVTVASHGLVHIDHRLLTKEAQEMSILVSCSLTGAKMFVPPFNKYNLDTENICLDNGIYLVHFEDGWLSMEYNKFNPDHRRWYLHAREWNMKTLQHWFLKGM